MPEFPLGRQEVAQIDRTLARLADSGVDVTLRFTNHWADDGENPALLAAALMGPLRDVRLVVDAEDEEAVDGLLSFGVATALSRRGAEVTSFVGPAARLDAESLRLLWTPGSRSATEALFTTAPGPVDAFGPRHATFVNPHLSSSADGDPDVVFLVRRWLTRRLQSDHDKQTVGAVGLVVDELVSNVQEHAADDRVRSPDCLLRVSMATVDRVRVSVIDTGVGLERSLRDKLEDDRAPAQRIVDLLAGDLPGWHAGRGMGLSRVAAEVAELGGRISVATEGHRVVCDGSSIAARSDAFRLDGTVIDCTIPTTRS